MNVSTDRLSPALGMITGTFAGINDSGKHSSPTFQEGSHRAISEPGPGWFECGDYSTSLPVKSSYQYLGLQTKICMRVEVEPVTLSVTLTDTLHNIVQQFGPYIVQVGETNDSTSGRGMNSEGEVVEWPEEKFYSLFLGGPTNLLGMPVDKTWLKTKRPFNRPQLTFRLEKEGGRLILSGVPSFTLYYTRPDGPFPGDGVPDIALLPILDALPIPPGFTKMVQSGTDARLGPVVILPGDISTGWFNSCWFYDTTGKWQGAVDNVFNSQDVELSFWSDLFRNDIGETLIASVCEIPEGWKFLHLEGNMGYAKTETDKGLPGVPVIDKWPSNLWQYLDDSTYALPDGSITKAHHRLQLPLAPSRWACMSRYQTAAAIGETAYYHLGARVVSPNSEICSWTRPDRNMRIRYPSILMPVGLELRPIGTVGENISF